MEQEVSPELKDIQIAIQRFCHVNKHHVIFISDFIVFDPETRKVKENILDMYGQNNILQPALDNLKKIADKDANTNSHNFVNI